LAGTDPVAPAFIAGTGPVPATFNADVQAPFTFLTSKVAFRAQRQAAQALGGASFTLMQYDTVLEDPYGGWSATVTGSQPAWSWLCPAGCSGWYEISMTAFTANPGTTSDLLVTTVYLDGSAYLQASAGWGADGHAAGSCGSVPVALYGGQDYIQGYTYTQAAVSTLATTGQYPTIEVTWISL
jgi:hypothetical protein